MRSVAAFVVPGDLEQVTGGYLYDRSLIEALRASGRNIIQTELPASFPDPNPADLARTTDALRALPPGVPVIVDGLAYGALPPETIAAVQGPIVALVHHPLGLESGLAPDRAKTLIATERQALRHAAHVLVPSPHVARILEARFAVAPDRITVVQPGFAAPDPVRIARTPPLVLSVGLLIRRKGHDILLGALARLADLDWRAEIVGSPRDPTVATALQMQRDASGLARRVGLPGEISPLALRDLYRSAHVFALASRYEGYGIVFAEAQLHGLPIVAANAGAVSDTVPPDAGILVPPDDVEAFAAALRQVVTDGALHARMSAASARASAHLPSWADAAEVVGAVLDRVQVSSSRA